MAYPDRVIHNIETRESTTVAVTDEWVLANKPNIALLSLSAAQIISDNIDSSVLTVTLQTPELIDGSHDAVPSSETVQIQIDADVDYIDVVLTGGVGTTNLTSDTAGDFIIKCVTYESDEITLEVINA